jgi:hypothetical protein
MLVRAQDFKEEGREDDDDDEADNHDLEPGSRYRRRNNTSPTPQSPPFHETSRGPHYTTHPFATRARPPDTKKAHTVFVSNIKSFFPLLCANAVLFMHGASRDVCAVWFKKSGNTCAKEQALAS